MYTHTYIHIHTHNSVQLTTENTTTTCVPSLFCPRSRTTSEVVVRRAFGLYVQQQLLEILRQPPRGKTWQDTSELVFSWG